MAIQVLWDNDDKTIIRYIFAGRWTWEEMHQAAQEMQRLITGITHTVHLIIDLTSSRLIPAGSFAGHIRSESSRLPENIGLVVIVGNSLMLKVIQQVMTVIPSRKPRKGVIKTSLKEAYQAISEYTAGQAT